MPLLSNYHSGIPEAGVDEAGRGCLAGPVVAAAVILPEDFWDVRLNDSKKISEKIRYQLREVIQENALAWNVGIISAQRIDEVNILNAAIEAMHQALDGLSIHPEHILVDGNRFKPWQDIPYTCIIKGDGKYASIAAASILAKTFRDDLMNMLHTADPRFAWNSNKGYGTRKHVEALYETGRTIHHRKTFNIPAQLKLF